MSALRNLGRRPDGSRGPWERRVLLWLVGAAVFAALSVTAAFYFDVVTESEFFCGQLCHPNRPELATWKISTHRDVECGTCHIGPGLLPKVTAKIYGTAELWALIANTYERPIAPPVERMRPAEVTCGQCHWSEKQFGDEVHSLVQFATDEENSASYTSVVLRTDDSMSPTQDQGAHFHIDHPVSFVARDREKQDIPWVAIEEGGELVAYQVQDDPLTPEQLATMERQELDCMDCHSRPAHEFLPPERVLDEALAEGRIDASLPFIKREGDRLLTASYATQDAGIQAMEELASFYSSQYPDVYAAQQEAVNEAVAVLQEIYSETVFPSMNLDWRAYPNNLGHLDSPGCFRCHDGEHLNAQEQAIPPNCTTCHSVPVAFDAGQSPEAVPAASLVSQLAASKPDSHQASDFLVEHGSLANSSCAECHGPIQYGKDNTSFCANEACHAQTWPGLDLAASFEHPVALVGNHAQALCDQCHGGDQQPTSIDDCAACHQPPSEPHFGPDCAQCHTPEGFEESGRASVASGFEHPVALVGQHADVDCDSCHGGQPLPASLDDCAACHQPPSQPHFGTECSQCHTPEGFEESGRASLASGFEHPVALVGQHADVDCDSCHGDQPLPTSLNDCAACHQPPSQPHFGEECSQCHTPEGFEESAQAWLGSAQAPEMEHGVTGLDNCLGCHGGQIEKSVPSSHAGWPNETCLLCHEEKEEGAGD